MPMVRAGEPYSRWKWLLCAVALTTACRIPLALLTYGTNDACMWESSAQLIRDGGAPSIYRHLVKVDDPDGQFLDEQIYNHPPFMIRLLSVLNRVKDAAGIEVRQSLRLMDAAADAGTILLTAFILETMFGTFPLWPLLLVALAPAWMFISGFHANSDPIMVFFLVLAVYWMEVRESPDLGVLSFALATGIKIVPVLLAPALFLYLKTWKARLRGAAILAAFSFVTAFPWLMGSPRALIRNTLGYGSVPGCWGITLLIRKIPVIGYDIQDWFSGWSGRVILIGAVLTASWYMNRRRRSVPLFCQFGVLLFLFLLLSPGFGIQYLAWIMPWAAALPLAITLPYFAASGIFSAAAYTFWSRGLPWDFANSVGHPWRRGVLWLGLGTWAAVAVILYGYWRLLRQQPAPEREDVHVWGSASLSNPA